MDIADPGYTYNPGANTFSATTDTAGNMGSGQTRFTVSVDAPSLAKAIDQVVTNNGIANSLMFVALNPRREQEIPQSLGGRRQ